MIYIYIYRTQALRAPRSTGEARLGVLRVRNNIENNFRDEGLQQKTIIGISYHEVFKKQQF